MIMLANLDPLSDCSSDTVTNLTFFFLQTFCSIVLSEPETTRHQSKVLLPLIASTVRMDVASYFRLCSQVCQRPII